MHYRTFGRTDRDVSEIGFGAWGIGGDAWGQTDDAVSLAALHKAIDEGVNFIDTADVYGNGHSERLVTQVRKERSEKLFIATKAGRRLNPHIAEGYNNAQNLTGFVERSLRNLEVEALDLLQLHCPPSDVYDNPEVFAILDTLVQQGKVRNYGVSVEKVEEAIKAIQYPNVKSVQIIFNIFRLKPAEAFFAAAHARNVGIIVRVPLASGLLTGKFKADTQFSSTDHRNYNRYGQSFDQGETFSGVDYDSGLEAVEELRALVPAGTTLAQFALRWILMFPEVSTIIPGAKNAAQAADNAHASQLAPLSDETMRRIQALYDTKIRAQVQNRW
jgi:aryl-alcohol dehydrogenase-like predicted oxidoreductase